MKQSRLYARSQPQRQAFAGGVLIGILLGFGLQALWAHAIQPALFKSQAEQSVASEPTDTTAPEEDDTVSAEDNADQPEVLETVTYVVQPGDSLSKIASLYGTTTDTLLLLNQLDNADTIYAGQELIVQGVLPQITYALVENNVLKLLTTSVDGTGEVLLMTAKVFDENPVVQLTDRQDMILYTESTLSGGTGAKTFISNIDGTERREVVSSDLALPKDLGQLWSPDGRFILYSFENNLWLYRLESGETTLVTDALTRKDAAASLPLYAWHPKQDSLLYVKDTATVVLYQIDSREGAELLDLGDQTIVQIYWPYANYIYAICAVPGGDRVIQKITIASKSAEPVAENTLPEQALVFDQESFDFVFSVDGIADASRHAEEGLWLYDAETQRLLQLVSESASVLIPVGYAREWSGQVYFKRVDGSTVTLGAVDLESGDMTRLKYGRGLYLFE